ncbi:MAG: hypothetical protein QOK12_3150 [Mycobacterium sp.]|jgi:hypothetical protein|nr:hypothetical protein [Mycobacterium sp.]
MDSYLAPAHRLTIASAACLALLAITMPSATAEPTSDSQGFVDSTARCSSPNTAAAFGSTDTSRVAICESPSGQYEYRGVRVRDGAKLIISATRSSDGKFVAENDGITYTVTPRSLVVSVGSEVIRTEPMVDYHGPESPTTPTATAPTTATTSTTPTSTTPTSTTPLPPPLPAERGGTTPG